MKKYLYSLLFLTSLQATIRASAIWSVMFAKPTAVQDAKTGTYKIYKTIKPTYFEEATELIITLNDVPKDHQQDLEIGFTENVLDAIENFRHKNLKSIDLCDETKTQTIKRINPFALTKGKGFEKVIAITSTNKTFSVVRNGKVQAPLMERESDIYKRH